MIKIEDNHLVFQFPDVHEDAETAIQFRRTLRIPDDGKTYLLPPSHRAFPPRRVGGGGIAIPLYQADAMWVAFSGGRLDGFPCAIKIAAGEINAISGDPWKPELDAAEDDYLVIPKQPRLDGFCIAMGKVRQFVAMPLGSGYPVAEQLTGKADHGEFQIVVYPMRRQRYQRTLRNGYEQLVWLMNFFSMGATSNFFPETPYFRRLLSAEMSLAAGGRMKQPIFKDPYGIDAWDQTAGISCTITLANAHQWPKLTGEPMPTEPPTAEDYAEVGLPWFDDYAPEAEMLPGSAKLALAKSVAEKAEEKGEQPLGPDGEIKPDKIIRRGPGEASRT